MDAIKKKRVVEKKNCMGAKDTAKGRWSRAMHGLESALRWGRGIAIQG